MKPLSTPILLTDSYKGSHAPQYESGTSNIYSYFESRGGEFDEIVLCGYQYPIKQYLTGQVVTEADIQEAKSYFDPHMGPNIFNEAGWRYILEAHGGRLPLSIKAAPEGSVIPPGNVLMTVENTDPECFWLTNYVETLLVQTWYPSTVATISREQKKVIHNALVRSGDPSLLPFKLHDFGCRGVSCMEQAAIGGFAHLVNFMGTDTIPALWMAREFYNESMAGFSIPAAEHSTITSWGKDNEKDAFKNMLEKFPEGLVAVVSDSWDIYNAVSNIWGGSLKSEVLARTGTVVIRPDSGEPQEVCVNILKILWDKFGGTVNEKQFKVLDDRVRIIQGDGIDRVSLYRILERIMAAGFSADNIAFGSGGGLLQDCDRDTSKYAFKCSSAVVNGEQRDVFKQPATADWKSSKKGRLSLYKKANEFYTLSDGQWQTMEVKIDQLVEVFRNGELLVDQNLKDIRERAEIVKETQAVA